MAAKFGGKYGAFGDAGEDVARRYLKANDYCVLPVSWIDNGGAPMLESDIKDMVMPDIIAAHKGVAILIDVKTKTKTVPSVLRGRIETGCSVRHYQSYLACGKALGMRPAILFIHADRTDMLLGFLDEVADDEALPQ